MVQFKWKTAFLYVEHKFRCALGEFDDGRNGGMMKRLRFLFKYWQFSLFLYFIFFSFLIGTHFAIKKHKDLFFPYFISKKSKEEPILYRFKKPFPFFCVHVYVFALFSERRYIHKQQGKWANHLMPKIIKHHGKIVFWWLEFCWHTHWV